jgi:hypothetical protein
VAGHHQRHDRGVLRRRLGGELLDRPHHPRDDHPPVLERLTQTFDRVAAELGELVEEQDTVVPECEVITPDGRSTWSVEGGSRGLASAGTKTVAGRGRGLDC